MDYVDGEGHWSRAQDVTEIMRMNAFERMAYKTQAELALKEQEIQGKMALKRQEMASEFELDRTKLVMGEQGGGLTNIRGIN